MLKPIYLYPDPILTKVCERIYPSANDHSYLEELIQDLKDTTNHFKALGLAANQIGVDKQVLVYRDNDGELQVLINPKIVDIGDEIDKKLESCLSIPYTSITIERPLEVTIKALNDKLKSITLYYDGTSMEGRIVQHEIDHLFGVTIFDHASKLCKTMAIDKYMQKRKIVHRKETREFNATYKDR